MSLAAVIEWCKSEAAATPATPQIIQPGTPIQGFSAQKPGFCYPCYPAKTPGVTAKKPLFSEEKPLGVTPDTRVTPQTSKVQTRIDKFAEKAPAIEPTECDSDALEGAEKLDLEQLDAPAPAPTAPTGNTSIVAANKALYTRLVLAAYRACSTPEERLSMRADCLEIELEHVLELAEHFEAAYPVAPPPAPPPPKHWSLEP